MDRTIEESAMNIENLVRAAKANARSIELEERWWTGSDLCWALGFHPAPSNGTFYELKRINPEHRMPLPVGDKRRPVMVNEAGIRALAQIAMKKEAKHAA
jgi:hypothetical protein